MSSLFGQVWLWSLLSFVAGVALTWLVLVRPAKREVQDLEERLVGASPRPVAPVAAPLPAPAEPARDEFDDWHRSSSPVEDLLRDDDPPHYDVANMKLDERDRLLEELDDEHRPLSDFEEQHDFPEYEDDRPRSLFERLSPSAEPVTTTSSAADADEPPSLPAEETHHLPPAQPVAEVAVPRQPEPTAPPEVEAFQPREVWREEPPEPVVYGEDEDPAEGPEQEDEPERPAEQTTLIPATALAQAIAEVDARNEDARDEPRFEETRPEESRFDEPRVEESRAEEPRFEEPVAEQSRLAEPQQVWPDRDLTGEYPVIRAELPTPEPVRPDLPKPERPGPPAAELFTPDATTILDARDIAAHTPAAHTPAAHTPTPEPSRPEPAPRLERQPESAPEPRHEARPESRPEPRPEAHDEAHALPGAPTRPEPVEPRAETAPEEPFVPRFQPEAAPEPRTEARPEARPEPQSEPRPEPRPEPQPTKEPARPRSLFEPVLTPEDEIVDEPPAPPKPKPAAPGNDQPFVPKLAPELLEPGSNGGLPQRPVRPAGSRTTPPPPPPPAPAQPINPPPPARPVRPRPVGFSPSTGGRPANTTTRYQQPEGFNPRSPFGPGSVLPKSDGKAPAPDFQVKATLTGRRYFTTESANFSETRADVWFRTISDAEKAGFRPAP
ncbi:hypothetical protein [Saccharothrix sp.]|uniref:sunset domain-containing protein n=1 Tax=Saccharothrix sp. TaxID=1873460 RepID=UPI002811BA79|nr:hypothetical protein [Saccharothrix sp.]